VPFNSPIPESRPARKSSPAVDAWVQAEKLMQIAILLPAAAFIGWLAGAWLDSRLHQGWIAIFGTVFGSISGLVSAIRMAMAAERSSRPGSKAENGTGKGSSDNPS
jgi:membrane associated rhomboid family serine protease